MKNKQDEKTLGNKDLSPHICHTREGVQKSLNIKSS